MQRREQVGLDGVTACI